jgi:hypothetical protein
MKHEHATSAQRTGILLSVVEAFLFAFAASLHYGFEFHVAGVTFATPFLYSAAIIEAVLALGLLVAVLVPGTSSGRAGRVIAAQILAVIGVFVTQVALMRAPMLAISRNEIFYGVALVFAVGSLVLLASPGFRRGAHRM